MQTGNSKSSTGAFVRNTVVKRRADVFWAAKKYQPSEILRWGHVSTHEEISGISDDYAVIFGRDRENETSDYKNFLSPFLSSLLLCNGICLLSIFRQLPQTFFI